MRVERRVGCCVTLYLLVNELVGTPILEEIPVVLAEERVEGLISSPVMGNRRNYAHCQGIVRGLLLGRTIRATTNTKVRITLPANRDIPLSQYLLTSYPRFLISP